MENKYGEKTIEEVISKALKKASNVNDIEPLIGASSTVLIADTEKSLEYNEEEVKKGIELANQESSFFKNCKSSYLREAVDLLNPLIDGFKKTGNMHVYSELYIIREKIKKFIK